MLLGAHIAEMLRSCANCGQSNRIPTERLHEQAKCGQCKAHISPPGEPVDIESEAEFNDLVSKSPLPVLVDFWAPWCGPCRMVAPELAKVAAQRQGQVVVAKVNTDELQTIAGRYQISGIPTMILFRDGNVAHRASGARPAGGILREFSL